MSANIAVTRPEASAAMRRIDAQIQQFQAEALAAGVDPLSSNEYGDLLADWLEAAHVVFCRDEAESAA